MVKFHCNWGQTVSYLKWTVQFKFPAMGLGSPKWTGWFPSNAFELGSKTFLTLDNLQDLLVKFVFNFKAISSFWARCHVFPDSPSNLPLSEHLSQLADYWFILLWQLVKGEILWHPSERAPTLWDIIACSNKSIVRAWALPTRVICIVSWGNFLLPVTVPTKNYHPLFKNLLLHYTSTPRPT